MEAGSRVKLKIVRKKDAGVYLSDGTDDVLLPRKQVPQEAKTGDTIEVFIYRDSEDRLIATVNTPLIEKGMIRSLKVKSVTGIGAFMDWGLERDLFLPFKEQTGKVAAGKSYPVRLYTDKTGRLCASMRLYEYLEKDPPYKKGDHVRGQVYQVKPDFGAFVVLEEKYGGLIHASELYDRISIGDTVDVRVVEVRSDGKVDLSLRDTIPHQMEEDAEMVLDVIKSYGGVLPFTDKADPERIREEFGLSKNAFKRAVGHLLKEHKIEITEKSIKLKDE